MQRLPALPICYKCAIPGRSRTPAARSVSGINLSSPREGVDFCSRAVHYMRARQTCRAAKCAPAAHRLRARNATAPCRPTAPPAPAARTEAPGRARRARGAPQYYPPCYPAAAVAVSAGQQIQIQIRSRSRIT